MNSNENLNNNNVENNNSEKKNNPIKNIGSKIGASIEGLIVFLLIFTVIVIVVSTFFEEQLEQAGIEIDDEYEDDYDYREYHFNPDYSIGTSSNYIIENNNTVSVDELTQSELFNEILKQTTKEDLDNSIIEEDFVEDNYSVNDVEDDKVGEFDYSPDYDDSTMFFKEEFEKAKEKLIITDEGVTVNNELMVSFDNQNSTILHDLEVYAVFYSDNEIVDVKRSFVKIINANSKYYLKFRYDIGNYDRYEILVSKEYYGAYNEFLINDYIEYTSQNDSGNVIINYENNSDDYLDAIEFSVLYYDKNNKLIDIENNLCNYSKAQSGTVEAYGSWDVTQNRGLKYDHYKVILDYAEVFRY